MSNYIGLSLMAKRQEDAEKLALRASELLKELDPDDQRGVHFDQFLTLTNAKEASSLPAISTRS